MSKRRPSRIVWVHRARAIGWLVLGVAAFPLGWAGMVEVVWMASVYANVFTDWGAGEAADNSEILQRLDKMEDTHARRLDRLEALIRGTE